MAVYPLAQSAPYNRGIQQAVPGLPTYLLGSLNRTVPPTRLNITTLSLASGTATVTGTVVEGQIPVVGQLVSITGAVPSYFNVNNVAIATVSSAATPDIGVYTITFTLANSFVAPNTKSPGVAMIPQAEVGDAVTLGGGVTWTSTPCSIQENINPANGKALRADVSFPTLPGGCIVNLQTADRDVDSEYVTLATVATVTGGVLSGVTSPGTTSSIIVANVQALFCRFQVTSIAAAASATVVGKVSI